VQIVGRTGGSEQGGVFAGSGDQHGKKAGGAENGVVRVMRGRGASTCSPSLKRTQRWCSSSAGEYGNRLAVWPSGPMPKYGNIKTAVGEGPAQILFVAKIAVGQADRHGMTWAEEWAPCRSARIESWRSSASDRHQARIARRPATGGCETSRLRRSAHQLPAIG